MTEQGRPARGAWLPVVLLMAALIMSRPNILGEILTPVGLGLSIAAAVICVLIDRTIRWSWKAGPILGFIALGQAWLLFRRGDTGLSADPRGSLILLAVLFCAAVVLSDRDRAVRFGKLFVGITLTLCASAAVTAALWLTGTSIILFEFFTGQWFAHVLFPFTPSVGSVWLNGAITPRFSGIGREPGWMGMYIALATVAWRWVGRPRWWGYLLLGVGLICTLSTAGFGIFIVVVAYEIFFRGRAGESLGQRSTRLLAGTLMVAGAIWVALYAPVVGLLAKSDVNVLSLEERSAVFARGLAALGELSLGSPTGVANDGIGLIAATAPNGWPYFLLVTLAFAVPLAAATRHRRPVAMVLVLYLTILLAQPPQDSVAVYAFLLAAFAWVRPETIRPARVANRAIRASAPA